MRRRLFLVAALTAITSVGLWLGPRGHVAAQSLPASVSDKDFWSMIVGFSEPGGFFRSDNLISNELAYQHVIPELQKTPQPGAYLGVGPDQNFTYITAMRPKMAFIVDIRRQNMLLHLMYKALVEMSTDRIDFLSHLFSRPRPDGVGADSTLQAIFDAFETTTGTETMAQTNLRAIFDHLEKTHGFPLTEEDENGIKYVFRSFYLGGPDIRYSFPRADFGGGQWFPTYAELMTQTDLRGLNHSYIGSEQSFRILKDYEKSNLIVPLVGDFAGDKALRAVGRYLKEHDATVAAFYTSNVEQYLFQQRDDWSRFYSNVETLPLNASSTFIRSVASSRRYQTMNGRASLLCPIERLLDAFRNDRIDGYSEVIWMSH